MSDQIVDDVISVDDMPQAVGWRILIAPIKIEEKTAGGIIKPESVTDAAKYLLTVGKVIGMGDLCYQHAKFEGKAPWCKMGDWVSFKEYTGQAISIRNKSGDLTELRIINDDEVTTVLPNPEAVLIYV